MLPYGGHGSEEVSKSQTTQLMYIHQQHALGIDTSLTSLIFGGLGNDPSFA